MSKIFSKVVEKSSRKKKAKSKAYKRPKNVVLKDDGWYVRKVYNKAGKTFQIWKVCHEQTEDAAKEILAEIENDIALARAGRPKPLSKFSEIADHFISSHITPAVFENSIKISGLIEQDKPKLYLERAKHFFLDTPISQITFGNLLDYKKHRLSTPIIYKSGRKKQRSIRAVNYELSVLKQLFTYAVQHRWLDRNPFLDGKNLIETRSENKRYKNWTKDEEQKCLSFCIGYYAHMKAVIILIVDGGFRKSELLNSRWSEVDFANETMLARNYKGKSFSIREVYLTKRMIEVLKEWKKIQAKRKRPDKSLVIGYKDIKNAWNHLREKINRKDLRIHDLRHVFATRLDERKNSISHISKLLGHSNIRTTQIYINPDTKRLRDAIKTLED